MTPEHYGPHRGHCQPLDSCREWDEVPDNPGLNMWKVRRKMKPAARPTWVARPVDTNGASLPAWHLVYTVDTVHPIKTIHPHRAAAKH